VIGPVIVAVTAPMFGRLAARVGQRRLLIPGGLIWALGGVLLLHSRPSRPEDRSASQLPPGPPGAD